MYRYYKTDNTRQILQDNTSGFIVQFVAFQDNTSGFIVQFVTLSRPGFLEICEKSRYTLLQLSDQCSLVDVNDAKIWKDFLSYIGQPFLSEKYTYGFMIKVDWFQPFKHRKYSVGVIYVVLMNLP